MGKPISRADACLLVNLIFRNKLQWNFNKNIQIFFKEKVYLKISLHIVQA